MKIKVYYFGVFISFMLIFSLFLGCNSKNGFDKNLNSQENNYEKGINNTQPQNDNYNKSLNSSSAKDKPDSANKNVDYDKVKPNELGEVMILMFHNFGENEKDSWWRSFENFRKDLNILYEKGYRLISLHDFINNNIDVPAGKTPVVFTFDDATLGQFSLLEEAGKLTLNPKSAVGIMTEFNKIHPDFGLEGTFYINEEAFVGSKGTEKERLQYLLDLGFDVGNHTYGHVNLGKADSATIQKSIGQHIEKMNKYFPGYKHSTLALPFGSYSNSTFSFIENGIYKDISYKNEGILLVGWKPSPPVGHRDLNLSKILRVRGSEGIPNDMYYYLNYFDKNSDKKYVSDGDKDTISVPGIYKDYIVDEKLKNKKVVIY